jgi:hypothetical protein
MRHILYVTYTAEDLAEHARHAVRTAREAGWEVKIGPDFGFSQQSRLTAAAQADALLLLSARRYTNNNDGEGRPIQEREWDAAQNAGRPARALLVDPSSAWPLNQIETRTGDLLDAFHEKLRRVGDVAYFTIEPQSVAEGVARQLTMLKADISQRRGVSVFVVWDTTIPGLELILANLHKRPPSRMTIDVPALSTDVSGGHLLQNVVLKGIMENDRVLVVADRPNANVAFEVGLALGFGKMIALVHFGPEIPLWLKESVFRGFIVNPVSDLRRLNEVLHNDNAWHRSEAPGVVPAVGETLFLSPTKYVGQALREEQAALFPDWITLPENGVVLEDLATQLGSVAQVVWSIASFSEGSELRDGIENAANGIISGWFYARAHHLAANGAVKRLRVIRQVQAREVVDVASIEHRFQNLDDFASILLEIPEYDLPEPLKLDEREEGFGSYRMVRIPRAEAKPAAWVGIYPVTNRQYALFCKQTGRALPKHMAGGQFTPDEPVVHVSLEDAEAFCQAASLSLPDPELWKEFTLAGSLHRYWWGNRDSVIDKVAWHQGNSGGRVHRVGEKQPNTWGLFDLLGNVWEWTARFAEGAANPRDPLAERREIVWKAKVLGGAFNEYPTDLRSSPAYDVSASGPAIGFRCVTIG